MIKDNEIIIMNDVLAPLYIAQEYATHIPGAYELEDPKINDVVILEIPGKPNNNELDIIWKIRIVLGLPEDIFLAKKQEFGNLYAVYRNNKLLLNTMNQQYLFSYSDLKKMQFDEHLKRNCKANEYFLWSTRVFSYNNFYKGGFVHKKYITGKILARKSGEFIFNTSNNPRETNTTYFL